MATTAAHLGIRTLKGQASYEDWKADILGFATTHGSRAHLDGTATDPPRPEQDCKTIDLEIWRDKVKRYEQAEQDLRVTIYYSLAPDLRQNLDPVLQKSIHEQ
jgi:hypothetical protein